MYFVVKGGLNFSKSDHQNLICGGQFCNKDSLSTQVYVASKSSNSSYIARPASSWIDDYFDWSALTDCCKYFPNNGSFCPHNSNLTILHRFVVGFDSFGCIVSDMDCRSCDIQMSPISRPNSTGFEQYLPFFLQDNPDEQCAKGGHAAYGNAVNVRTQDRTVDSSYFMAYHTILKSSADYYEALRSARKISHNITQMIQANLRLEGVSEEIIADVQVFPYSVFYVSCGRLFCVCVVISRPLIQSAYCFRRYSTNST